MSTGYIYFLLVLCDKARKSCPLISRGHHKHLGGHLYITIRGMYVYGYVCLYVLIVQYIYDKSQSQRIADFSDTVCVSFLSSTCASAELICRGFNSKTRSVKPADNVMLGEAMKNPQLHRESCSTAILPYPAKLKSP